MSNIIQFLETMGRNPALSRFSAAEYAANVAALNADDSERQALLTRDDSALSLLIGGRQRMFCAIYAPDEEQKDDNQREREEPIQDTPPESE